MTQPATTRPDPAAGATTTPAVPFPHWRLDALLLALGAIVIRIPALLAPTNLGYDDGGYGLAAVAMRQGFAPFRDIFSPQGPLFLPIVWVFDLLGLRTMAAPRLAAVAAGAAVTVAVYAIGRRTMDRGRALLAAGLVGSSGMLLWTTGPLTGDGVAAAFATWTVAAAIRYRDRPSTAGSIAIGLLAGAAVSVKSLLVGPALLVAWLLVVATRRWRCAVLVPTVALAVLLVAAAPWGLHDVANQSVRYHTDKTTNRKPVANLHKVATTAWERDLPMVVLGAAGLVTAIATRRRRGRQEPDRSTGWTRALDGTAFLWVWLGAVLAVLALQDPMFRNHIASLAAPLALLVARWRPPWRAVAVILVVTVPIQVFQLRELYAPKDYTGEAAQVVDALRALPRGSWALSDEPGFVWRAGHGTDPFYVDPSVLRIRSNVTPIKITEARVAQAARNPRVCGVVIWAPVRWGSFTGLPAQLETAGYRQTVTLPDGRGVWTRTDCGPGR